MFLRIFIFLCLYSVSAFSQGHRRNNTPVLHEVSNKAIVQSIYPDASRVQKINEFWYHVLNTNDQVIGFAMSSQPHCKEIIGYHGATPVMIITDTKGIIQKVALLSHYETLSYVRSLENAGFFDLWKNKSLKEAMNVYADAYSGATQTALAVEKNVRFLLENGINKMPARRR